MPISAFILCSCWIDQVALFVYNHNEENLDQHYKNFIKKYLRKYEEMDLYTNLRCKLVHSYSVGRNMRISLENNVFDTISFPTNVNEITAPTLLKDLRSAWEIVKNELLNINNPTRTNALGRFDKSPTLIEIETHNHDYSKEDAEFLIKYYKPYLKGKFLNEKKSLEIYTIDKKELPELPNRYTILVIIKKSKDIQFCEYLERVTQQFNLPFPEIVLLQK